MSRAADLQVLGFSVQESAPSVAQVKDHYRELALKKHPDAGGDVEAFQQLVAAYKRLLASADQPRPCASCQGKGKQTRQKGFRVEYQRCRGCGGKGKVRS